jgi:valyl-tRNA synthetase
MSELNKHYDPKIVEDKWNEFWNERKYFKASVNPEKTPFTIVIPPPNVTASLHMGHALNNTLQDIIIRFKRMQGFEALWLPGTDHAGIATQNVVERELQKEGKTRHDLGREKFIERVWEWKHKHRGRIVSQLKKIGSSCDWDRERFTLDEGLSNAVKEVFVRLYEKGDVYRGTYMINWCPRCATALSDEEVNHDSVNGHFWHFRYPYKEGEGYVELATTRPETMLGDTAVAVNPDDERYRHLVGKTLVLPLMDREIPVVADDYVDREFGTGVVKVTPAHDPNDYAIGKRHKLSEINILNNDGTLNANAGEYAGMDRFEARKKVVADLEARGLLIKVEDHQHSVGHCQRCNTVVEPIISTQWFARMGKMAEKAIAAVKNGDIKLHPNNKGYKNYLNWMENIHDWCISRQLWWGHRIPVWYCGDCDNEIVSRDEPSSCSNCDSTNLRQDTDVLDTWFSSWLWPFSTLGWPEKTPDLDYFYPTNVLVTAQDILFFWVSRMIMAGYEVMDEKPFSDVFLTGIVQDEIGRKMSKSLGNGIDPLAMVDKFGADAMRYTLVRSSSDGQDIRLSEHLLEVGRNFANKIWNAFRFVHMNLMDGIKSPSELQAHMTLADRWILTRLNQTIDGVSESLEKFRASEAMEKLYGFFWDEYCSWYLELIKNRLYKSETEAPKITAISIAVYVMKHSMEMMHPFMPFISEEIWQHLKAGDEESITVQHWPRTTAAFNWEADVETMVYLQNIVTEIRTVRAEMKVPAGKKAQLLYKKTTVALADHMQFFKLAGIESIQALSDAEEPTQSAGFVVAGDSFYLPMADLIDVDVERNRLEKEKNRLEKLISGIDKKLNNEKFTANAPEAVVAKEKEKLSHFGENLAKIDENIRRLT